MSGTRRPLKMQARAGVEIKEKDKAIRLGDVQGLVLWVLGEYTSPRWVFIKVRIRVAKTHACMLLWAMCRGWICMKRVCIM